MKFNPLVLAKHAVWLECIWEEKIPIHQGLMMRVKKEATERADCEKELILCIERSLVGHRQDASAWLPKTLKLADEAGQVYDGPLSALQRAELFKSTLSAEIMEMKQTLIAKSDEKLASAVKGAKEMGLEVTEDTDAVTVGAALTQALKTVSQESNVLNSKKRKLGIFEQDNTRPEAKALAIKERKLNVLKWDSVIAEAAAKCAREETPTGTPLRFPEMGVPLAERFRSLDEAVKA